MLFVLILASAHLVLVVVVVVVVIIRVAPFGTDGDRTMRIADGIGGSGCVGPGPSLGFCEFRFNVRCFGEFERRLRAFEFPDALLLWGLCQYGLKHIPMLRDTVFRLHDAPHCNRQFGLDSGRRAQRAGRHDEWGSRRECRMPNGESDGMKKSRALSDDAGPKADRRQECIVKSSSQKQRPAVSGALDETSRPPRVYHRCAREPVRTADGKDIGPGARHLSCAAGGRAGLCGGGRESG